jgi:hypothetical protein
MIAALVIMTLFVLAGVVLIAFCIFALVWSLIQPWRRRMGYLTEQEASIERLDAAIDAENYRMGMVGDLMALVDEDERLQKARLFYALLTPRWQGEVAKMVADDLADDPEASPTVVLEKAVFYAQNQEIALLPGVPDYAERCRLVESGLTARRIV